MNATRRTVTPSCRRSTSGRCSSTPGRSLIASTSRLAAANEAVGKYAVPPSPSTRQPSAPAASMNCFGLIGSVMRPPAHRQCRSDQPGGVMMSTARTIRAITRGCSELLLLCGFPLRVFPDLLLAELGILDVEDDRVGVTVTEAHARLQPRE